MSFSGDNDNDFSSSVTTEDNYTFTDYDVKSDVYHGDESFFNGLVGNRPQKRPKQDVEIWGVSRPTDFTPTAQTTPVPNLIVTPSQFQLSVDMINPDLPGLAFTTIPVLALLLLLLF